ncbi:hypothetical protein M569_02852, partial [Genlisea aurea]
SSSDMEKLDAPLSLFGFEIDEISAHKVSGHLLITPTCCQPFHVLHGGVSALISESLASLGACVASGFNRVAGVQLSINHHKPAKAGDFIVAEATPITIGRSIQVWEVYIAKLDQGNRTLVASSRLTLYCSIPLPESAADFVQLVKKHSKL